MLIMVTAILVVITMLFFPPSAPMGQVA